ncbi:MAG: AMP-binding protein [Kiritimatiellae bacterium]|nr:AMP-binding protein [Kiritimatiellia bacterium]
MEVDCYNGVEFVSPEESRGIRNRLFREHVAYCVRNSPFYRETLGGIDPSDPDVCVENITELPFTEKSHIESRNDDFLAVSASRIVDIVQSSGTTGKPTRVMYTERDLERLAYNERQSFAGCGISSDDIVLLTCTMDRCFVAGLAYFLGIRSLGAAAVRNGHGSMSSHLEVIRNMAPTAIVGVPTFLRKLGLYMQEEGLDPEGTEVTRLICIGEPLRDRNLDFLKLGRDIEEIWGAKAYSTYASSETVTTFCECTGQQGGHLHTDLAVVEIVDEEGRIVPDGKPGEVVVTPLAVEGMPLIRFKTGDISFILSDKCSCGRFSSRLGPIIGRKKQMMKVRGTTIYPQALYSALDEIAEVSEYYIVVDSEDDLSDDVTVCVSVIGDDVAPGLIQDKLQARIRVKPDIVVEDEEKVRSCVYSSKSRKPIHFIDKRKRDW